MANRGDEHDLQNPPPVRPAMRTNTDGDVLFDQHHGHLADAPVPFELLEDHADDRLDLFVWIKFESAVERTHIADGGREEDGSPPHLVQKPLPQTTPQDVQFRFAHRALESEQQPVVVIGRIVKSILVCQQRSEDGTEFEELVPILAGSGQSTHLDAEDQ